MPEESNLRYDVMVERALRGVLRQALAEVAEHGLPGDHHFYITFRTPHPGVEIPDYLSARYPTEMTIVIQYQFWGLRVTPEHFEVTLSFNEKPERLSVPFEAVTAFADPSVRFGLQFDAGDKAAAEGEEEAAERPDIAGAPTHAPNGQEADVAGRAGRQDRGDAVEAPVSAKIVTLDAFRKK